MKKILLMVLGFACFYGYGQVIINNTAIPYTQDFNTLASSGTSSTLPTGWVLVETGTGANTTYTAGTGSSGTGDTYSFGSNTDRAFGGLQSGSVIPTIGVQFSNTSGATITSLTINYTGEQWRLGTIARVDKLDFQYSLDATSLTTGTWVDHDPLDFTAPVSAGATGALDGNAAANRTAISAITISGLNINSGSTFWLRWNDLNASGADDGLGIDDFTVSFTGAGVPCTEPGFQPTSLNLIPTNTTIAGSFTASSPAADGYLVVRSLSNSLSASPNDGSTYSVGSNFGGGVIESSGPSLTFNSLGLIPNTVYHYFVFAFNSTACTGGPNYLSTTPLYDFTNTLPLPACTTPANPPTNLVLTPSSASISGTFNAAIGGATNYLVVRSTSPGSFTPINGTTYTPGQVVGAHVVVSFNTTTNFIANGLASTTLYYFFVFSANTNCTGEPYYNSNSLNGNAVSGNSGIPPGYYDGAAGLNCQNLKTALRNIVTAGHLTLNYSTIDNNEIPVVDTIRSDDGLSAIIWDIYSNNNNGIEPFTFNSSQTNPGGFCGGNFPSTEGVCWNKEHTFPKSWFKLSGSNYEQPTESDLFLVRPTDGQANSNRSNYIYSTVGTPYSYQMPIPGQFAGYPMPPNPVISKMGSSNYPGISSTNAFEPNNAVKGDLARGYFYILTRYQNNLNNWVNLNGPATDVDIVVDGTTNGGLYPSLNIPYLQLLYSWHLADPVDAKEINRNNLVYSQQNNRNPYVDHPEYVAQVWECTGVIPVTLISFSAQKNNESVLLKWQATRETSFKEYEIQRSTDGINFYKTASVTGSNFANYNYTDNRLPVAKNVFYRLKMIDIDGRFSYSKIVSVKLNDNFYDAAIFPNPAANKITVKMEQLFFAKTMVQVTDMAGRTVLQTSIPPAQNNFEMDVKQLPTGRYLIQISSGNEFINKSFVIIR